MESGQNFRLELACIVSVLPYRRGFFRRGGFRTLDSNLENWPKQLAYIFGPQWIEKGRQTFRDLKKLGSFQKLISCISVHFIQEASYPDQLLHIFDAPGVLWLLSPENSQPGVPWKDRSSMAVVGTRSPERVSLLATEKLVRIAGKHSLIVSGLARGVDACAHRACLEMGGSTVAVLGAGVLKAGPEENSHLWNNNYPGEMHLVSEFLPGLQARSYHFPRRNRIIAGLSGSIALMQAPQNSGALISASFALEEGRDLMVFDHPLLQKPGANEGARKLLQQGAYDLQQDLNLIPADSIHRLPDGPADPDHELWLHKKLQAGEMRPLGQGLLFLDS
ncbi:MAG TPA: hypothetical protein DEA96_05330 [Leptospiraceae bacterium]|nr:hypothetical protein [Spirochaetaceae bacterium]HBS04364.1 hypothetical protein [Leptospiraceae bacterium]|tara:strand:+ start:6346 stop:7347 length:1002 start_codon:yes stop_codon:yes gene_type:complete